MPDPSDLSSVRDQAVGRMRQVVADDIIGAVACLMGVAVIMYAPRAESTMD